MRLMHFRNSSSCSLVLPITINRVCISSRGNIRNYELKWVLKILERFRERCGPALQDLDVWMLVQ